MDGHMHHRHHILMHMHTHVMMYSLHLSLTHTTHGGYVHAFNRPNVDWRDVDGRTSWRGRPEDTHMHTHRAKTYTPYMYQSPLIAASTKPSQDH